MRIIAGTYRSRILKSLKGQALRPTSDYLRETLFNVLGPAVAGSRFLDLYAGTGAVGIEAISRGAVESVFVESHAAAAKLIRENLATLQIVSGAKVIAAQVGPTLAKLAAGHDSPFDFVFLDPPYADEREYGMTMNILRTSSLLSHSSLVIAEHRKSFALAEAFGDLQKVRGLKQGDAVLSFYRLNP
jgi:16S rRNA (guanine(966)-N(2))-methyltransferase RsmD